LRFARGAAARCRDHAEAGAGARALPVRQETPRLRVPIHRSSSSPLGIPVIEHPLCGLPRRLVRMQSPDADAELYEALKAYTMVSVASLLEGGFVLEPESQGGWHARRDNTFVFREPRGTPAGLDEAIAAQHSRLEYQAALDALRAHPLIGTRLGKLVGTAFSRALLEEDRLPDRLLYPFVRRGCFDADAFDAAFKQLVESLTFETATWVVIAPLSGVASEATPIELEPGVEIIAMSDAEVIACLSTGLVTGFGSAGFTSVTNRIAIRLTERWPAIVGDDEHRAATDAHTRRTELVEGVVHVLRLLKDGDVSVPGTVAFSLSSFEGPLVPHFSLPISPPTVCVVSGSVRSRWSG